MVKREFVEILNGKNLNHGEIPPLGQEINLNPMMQHLQTLHDDFINLQGAYSRYLEKWLDNTELLSRSWTSTMIQIRALVDEFEKTVHERGERRWWGGNKGGLGELKKGYRNGRMGRKMMEEVRVRHWLQIRFARHVIQEIVGEGVILRKTLVDIERKIIGLGVLGDVLLGEICKAEEEAVRQKENEAKRHWVLVRLRKLLKENHNAGKGKGKIVKKHRQEESLLGN
ncbi:hypothetical protein EAE99_011596 [Botrytis elliptica]|nr:hypothetical protein EAE99_011596 [Botrytis elliptica]